MLDHLGQRISIMKKFLFFLVLVLTKTVFANPTLATLATLGAGSACYEEDLTWTPASGTLVGLWHLNNNLLATVGPNMTASGSTFTATSKLGAAAVSLNGSSTTFAASSTTYAFANQTFTVAAWVKTTSGGVVVSNGGSGLGWFMAVASGRLEVFLKNCVNNQVSMVSAASNLQDGNWHHAVAIIHTDTTVEANNTIQTYVDGMISLGTLVLPGTGPYCDPGAIAPLGLGARDLEYTANGFYTGSIDEVSVWNSALTPQQIKTIYDQQSCGKN